MGAPERSSWARSGPSANGARRRFGSSRGRPSGAAARARCRAHARVLALAARLLVDLRRRPDEQLLRELDEVLERGARRDGQLVEERHDAVVEDVRARLRAPRAGAERHLADAERDPERRARQLERGRGLRAAEAGTRLRRRHRDLDGVLGRREVDRVRHVEQPVDVDAAVGDDEALRVRGHARPSKSRSVGARRAPRAAAPIERDP